MTRILIAAVFIVLGSNNAHADTTRQSPFHTVEQLGRALVAIENHYVTPADRTTLLERAIRGMVAALDPLSSYMTRTLYEMDDVLQRIRGEHGTMVRLHIHRPVVDQPISLSIVRDEVHTRSVVGQRLDGDVAYIIIIEE